MVKVVGDAPEALKYTVCRHCAAKLEYVPKDVQRRDVKDYRGGSGVEEWINCPRCEHKVVLRAW